MEIFYLLLAFAIVGKLLVRYVLIQKLVDFVNVEVAHDLTQFIYLDVNIVEFGRFLLGPGLGGRRWFRFVFFGHIVKASFYFKI
jgi:hypothetical protein